MWHGVVTYLYSVSQKKSINFYTPIIRPYLRYTANFYSIISILTKLCHTKRDHPSNFWHFTSHIANGLYTEAVEFFFMNFGDMTKTDTDAGQA